MGKKKLGENKMLRNKDKIDKKKLLFSFMVSFIFAFTIFFYIPYETLSQNTATITFLIKSVIPIVLIVSVVVFVIVFLLLCILKALKWKIICNIFVFISFMAYIQSTFLNSNLGTLTGDSIDWDSLIVFMIIDLLLWILVCAILFYIMINLKNAWKLSIAIICIITIVMQIAGIVGTAVSGGGIQSQSTYELTYKDQNNFSSQKNIVVFCIDRFDEEYIEDVLRDDPKFFDRLDGFTKYDNATAMYFRTLPGANYLLTNHSYGAYHKDLKSFLDESWDYDDKHILKDLKNNGYKIDLYEETNTFFGNSSKFVDTVSNLENSTSNIDVGQFISNMFHVEMFRILPTMFKKPFVERATNINEGVEQINVDLFDMDEIPFRDSIDKMSLNEQKNFKFYHFWGCHAPYTLTEKGERSNMETNVVSQTKGTFEIIYKALDKMKEKGIYNDATIIITGDHGMIHDDSVPLDRAVRLGMFYKPSGKYGFPLSYSDSPVSQDNVPPTILKEARLDYANYGLSLDEVTNENTPKRYAYKTLTNEFSEYSMLKYEILSPASDFDNWKVIHKEEIQYSYN